MKGFPEISVLMSVHNDAQHVGMAVESILSQTYTNYEFVIIDDGSTDETHAVLMRYRDPRIRVSRNKRNLGLTCSLNRGIALSHGRYIARMDSDDLSLPERLGRQYHYLEAHPDIGVLGSAVRGIDAAGKTGSVMSFPSSHEEIVWSMFFECAIAHPAVMLRKHLLDEYGGYNPEFAHAQDAELWCRLAPVTRFANLENPLLTRRWHSSSIGSRRTAAQIDFGMRARQNLIEHYTGRSIPSPVMKALSRWSGSERCAIDPALCKTSISLLYELYDICTPVTCASPWIRAGIREDLIRRVLSLARASARDPRMWGYLAVRLKLDKAVVARLSLRHLLGRVR